MPRGKIWTSRRFDWLIRAALILLVLSLLTGIVAGRKAETGEFLVMLSLCLFYVGTAINRTSIAADDDGIEVRRRFGRVRIPWEYLEDYTLSGGYVVLYPNRPDIAPLTVNLGLIERQGDLANLLQAKLGGPAFDCLRCGAKIGRKDESCPNCHWSWREGN